MDSVLHLLYISFIVTILTILMVSLFESIKGYIILGLLVYPIAYYINTIGSFLYFMHKAGYDNYNNQTNHIIQYDELYLKY